ncbi:amidohydrolase family protein [Sphingomonas sp. SRS2]|uniref:amidohydrolase family protein n=1 Tax=Sphingomonas sp. SRS2 TaxID=133190 RepID=UPI001364C71D|nr:amidohydrolase family protein [Sphingomonas sp. SRS2]
MRRWTAGLTGTLAFLLLASPAPSLGHDDKAEIPVAPSRQTSNAEIPAVIPQGKGLPLRPDRMLSFRTDEGSWMSPDLSPDGRRIMFELLGDLYMVDAQGGRARPIATGMAFDSQPVFSPDGHRIVFLSDRSGNENVWTSAADGSDARPITEIEEEAHFTSPSWSADGRSIFVSRYRADHAAFELLSVDAATGELTILAPIGGKDGASNVGAAASRDGRWLYYAAQVGDRDSQPPGFVIRRRDLRSGVTDTIVAPPRSYRPDLVLGTFFRPLPSPDGRHLVYATRYGAQMWLRLLDLETHADRWLASLGQHDELDGAPWRDLAPHYAFTPDSKALVVNDGGKLSRIALDGGKAPIAFTADVRVPLGPLNRVAIREEQGPVRARIIQQPAQSPDGARLAFSALGQIYVMPLGQSAAPRRLTSDAFGEFDPSWSPDGATIVYTRWTAREGGQLWTVAADGSEPPRRLTDAGPYYTSPVFTPDGRSIVAVRSSNDVRLHRYMEYGPLRDAELIVLPVAGGAARRIAKGVLGGVPHFGPDPSRVAVLFDDGLNLVALDGSGRTLLAQVTGPGYYFLSGRASVDDLRLSPDGKWLLAQVAQQLHLLEMPAAAAGKTFDIARPPARHRRLTDVGADFLQWSADGKVIGWAIGSTWFRRPLADIALDAAGVRPRGAEAGPALKDQAVVAVPRAVASGSILLRGGTALTMRRDEAVHDADILVTDGRIVGIGPRGSLAIAAGIEIRDVSGKWILPGFIDAHDHIADIRRQQLDLDSWGVAANLAYGVTTAFDPSTLSIDMLAYQDLLDAGLITGSRIRSTGPALFSFNEFTDKAQVDSVLDRYRDHYRLSNIKLYRTGSRRVRQWIAQSASEHGLMVATEGAGSDKLDLTQIQDGFSTSEHALPATPLYSDLVRFIARSGVGYNTTLMVNGGGQDHFIVEQHPNADPKLNRFAPRFIVDMKTRKRDWRELSDAMFPAYAAGAASVVRDGGLVGMGSHGELPGIGFHWEMAAHVMGGMTPMEALRAGTIGSARAIGREADFGSLESGKVADMLVLDRDPRADIRNSLSIRQVMLGGRLYDAETLDELWPHQRRFGRPWYRDDLPPGTPDPRASIPLPPIGK